MKVILSMAVSANGIIATKTGSEEFVSDENWFQFAKLAKKVGCIIWGRKTYESVIKWDEKYLRELNGVKKMVISHSDLKMLDGYELAKSPKEALDKLEKENFEEAIITGGSTINSAFAKAGLIDEVIFDVNPLILGEGIPIFNPEDFFISMKLIEVKKIENDIVELRYKVVK